MEVEMRNFGLSNSSRNQWTYRTQNSLLSNYSNQNSSNLDTSVNQTKTSLSFNNQLSRWETQEPVQVPDGVLCELCEALKQKQILLNSTDFDVNTSEFHKVLSAAAYFRNKFKLAHRTTWSIESGQGPSSSLDSEQAANERLAFHVFTAAGKVLGKFEVKQPLQKLIVSKASTQQQRRVMMLKDIDHLPSLEIKRLYRVPKNYLKLGEIQSSGLRVNTIGVVTSINKLPTKGRSFWHLFLCISDPSLIGEDNDRAPSEFKMHIFLPFITDFPEIHRGDVIRFTNVKVESHQNRCDGRIFSKDDWRVYCCQDDDTPMNERNEEFSTAVRILSKWWRVNDRFFDYMTPHPIYQDTYRYPGVRMLQEASDKLVFDLYCQVASISDESPDYNWLYVRDGTIFTLEKRTDGAGSKRRHSDPPDAAESPTYGFTALIVLNADQWRQTKSMKVAVNDYLMLHEVCATFVSEETFQEAGPCYPFRHPCILLRVQSTGMPIWIKKMPTNHHEAAKIRRRLHRLPDVLDQMKHWKFPEAAEEVAAQTSELTDPPVQLQILKRLKPF